METARNDLKWFGEGFDGFPKRLPEDCIEYTLHIINLKLQDVEIRQRLREVHKAATELTKKLLKDYIWQRDSFNLNLVRNDGLSHLFGRTNYGDSVEDEWLVVYLLRELSRKFADLWIKLVDTDGEFLLIEAAKVLPRWLNPEVADNRIWLHDGKLFIIPVQKPRTADEISPVARPLTIEEARKYIADHPAEIIHSPTIESEAFYRLRNYPGQIEESLHHAIVTIPRRVAYILHHNAAHISPAVEAFYLRDPIALKPLQGNDITKLVFPPNDLTTISVRFTKVGYAQLKSQQFSVPSVWDGKLPLVENSHDYARAEMGMKVTCGFEMLVSDVQNQDKISVREILMLLEDINSGADHLPTNEELMKTDQKDGDDKWLDIDFEEFERELAGKGRKDPDKATGNFGEKSTQESVRKMVQRFEEFLNDDDATAEGAELPDSMDFDDDEGTESDDSSDGEDKAVSFDENEFSRMMREMMGMPAEEETEYPPHAVRGEDASGSIKPDSVEEGSNEDDEIQNLTQQIEAELNAAGVLDLDPKIREIADTQAPLITNSTRQGLDDATANSRAGNKEDVDIDFNLVKNLLESYKSQAGMAGPGGNMLSTMGIHLPTDADDNLR